MKAILRSINNFGCKLKQINNLKYNISPKIRSNKFKSISGNGNVTIEDAIKRNLKDYKTYGNTVQSKLPDGYTQVDYIESSGTQYIDTGINADYKLSLDIKLTDILNTQKHMGAIRNNGNGTYTRHHFQTKNSNIQGSVVYYVDTSYYRIKNTSEQTNPHIYNIDLYNNTIQFDNEEPITITRTNFDTELNYWLFWRNRNEGLGQQDKGNFRIYYCKMYVGNELVRDFIPCYRNSDNEVGLYDLVSGVFYTNQGTGVFTYGSVAPTPDSPIEIVSCGDRTKNLCGALEQGGYDVNTGQTTINTSLYRNANPIKVSPNTNYIFSINGVGQAVNVLEYKADGTYIGRIGSGAVSSNSYFTTSSETGYINIFRGASAGIEKWQIEQNDTISSYEPYGYKIPINVRSDNLFDISEITSVANGTLSNNIITTKTSGSVANFNVAPIFPQKKLLSGHTYYLSADIRKKSGAGNFRKINDYVADWTSLISPTISDVFQKYVFTKTFTTDTAYYRFLFQFGNTNNAVFEIKNIKLSEVNEDYQPYYNETTNIYLDEPLRKIDEYSDYIDFKNGKVVRQLGEVILDGSEPNWYKGSDTSSNYYIHNQIINAIGNYSDGLSNYFINAKKYPNERKGLFAIRENGTSLMFNSDETTVGNWKNWLSENNVIVDYILATPTEEDIELPNINLIEGKNIITIGTDVQGVFETEYYSKEIIDISNYKYNLRKVED